MPELPEVEVTRLSFADRIAGAEVQGVFLGKPLRWPLGCEPSALVGRKMVGLTHHAGRNPLQVGVALGDQKLHVDACATGRALLATMGDDAVRELLGGEVSRATAQSPATMDELLGRLALVREQGYAESHNEAGKGVGAIAVAVRDERTTEVLSFCITFPEATVDAAEVRFLATGLLQARADIMRTPQ